MYNMATNLTNFYNFGIPNHFSHQTSLPQTETVNSGKLRNNLMLYTQKLLVCSGRNAFSMRATTVRSQN